MDKSTLAALKRFAAVLSVMAPDSAAQLQKLLRSVKAYAFADTRYAIRMPGGQIYGYWDTKQKARDGAGPECAGGRIIKCTVMTTDWVDA